MSINVTVNGNHLNIRRGRMVLSDLDQIKKNERDRRRRLKESLKEFPQVRQQSKEISDRLLERTKNIAKEELKKLENNEKLNLRQIYNGKIMEIQQKYQEDMADIGQAHISAALEPDHDAQTVQQQHQERLRQIREVENLRSSLIAKLPKEATPKEDTICVSVRDEQNKQEKSVKKKTKKILSKTSPGKITKAYIKVYSFHIIVILNFYSQIDIFCNFVYRYNPEDYVQTTSDSTNSDSSNSFSDDSSYFSDSGEQYMNKEIKTIKYVKCPATYKVQLYDHSKHQSNMYNQPVGAVEKIHAWNEPSAIDLAQEIERAQTAETHLLKSRKHSAQKRGVDAALREKVRRDYQILMQNLNHLASEERKLKASMEFSLIDPHDPHDETSLMQLPSPKLVANDLQSIRRLVENIEAIHNQLAKTLIESQKIIKNNTIINEETEQIKKAERVSSTNGDVSNNTSHPVEPKVEVEEAKIKPKIISEERVNIPLSRFKIQKSPQILTTSTPERDTWLTPKQYEKEMIEQLSKEILEQSEGFNNNLVTSKEIYNSTVKCSIQTSTDTDNFKNNTSSKVQADDVATKKHFNKESKKTKDFVPLLTDMPKVSKTIDSAVHTNGRSKPPVSLLSGPYRAEIESSGHELSTIIEFDTPDTVNKSQSNIRSPLSTKKIAETQITKSTVAVDPSEHIIPLNLHKQCSEKLWIINKKLQCGIVNQESLQMEKLQSFCYTSTDANNEYKGNKDKITSTSSNSFSELSGVSQIASTPSSTILKYASSPEEMEMALKKLGLGWAITTLKKTREASALSSSSNSDVTPINAVKRIISPVKKQFDSNYGLPDFSDVSSISIKEASKSTEQAVLLKGRTSTPKLQNSNSNSGRTNTSNTNISENFQEPDDGLIIPNISLTKT
ncbi:hypothetical protein WH47_07620, partial [Habropoda laboriosa]